jgi:hypothetical protein
MSDLLFDFNIARTEFSDAAYAAVGRALAFATRFEANCRALAVLIGVREAMKDRSAPDRESVDDLFEGLTQEYWQVRRLRHHETAVALYKKLPQDVRAVLRVGREAPKRDCARTRSEYGGRNPNRRRSKHAFEVTTQHRGLLIWRYENHCRVSRLLRSFRKELLIGSAMWTSKKQAGLTLASTDRLTAPAELCVSNETES